MKTVANEPIWVRMERAGNPWLAWSLARYRFAPDHPCKLRVWRWLHGLLGRPRLLTRYAGRAWMRLDPEDFVQAHILQFGAYEPEVWDTLASYAAENEVFWDVGGHVGGVAIRAALDPRIQIVHCFEPNPPTAAILQENLALNSSLAIRHHPIALAEETHERFLYAGPRHNTGIASLVVRPTNGGVLVGCDTADNWVAKGHADPPTLMKLDVEGAEAQVLTGAASLLETGRIKAIVFEAECNRAGEIRNAPLVHLLGQYGYSTQWIRRPNRHMSTRENYVAVRALCAP